MSDSYPARGILLEAAVLRFCPGRAVGADATATRAASDAATLVMVF
jgi:hypothetical protein